MSQASNVQVVELDNLEYEHSFVEECDLMFGPDLFAKAVSLAVT